MRTLTILPILLLAACGSGKPGDDAGSRTGRTMPPAADLTTAESQQLGRELFGIMDRVMAYKSDHFAQLPKDLPTLGIDSLTRATVRRLSIASGVPTLVVAFRHADGHALQGCTGTNKVIEDSMLNGGAFEVTCTLRNGETKVFTVGG